MLRPDFVNKHPGNWELSTDCSNAARRLMQHDGVRTDQSAQVRGYADQMLRKRDEPFAASNRRISVIVQNLEPKPEAPETTYGKQSSTPPQNPSKPD